MKVIVFRREDHLLVIVLPHVSTICLYDSGNSRIDMDNGNYYTLDAKETTQIKREMSI